MKSQYISKPLTFNRKAVRASASVTHQKNTIHSFTEVDISRPRSLMKEHFEKYGEKLSFTAYIVTCLARVIKQHPELNSFIKGRKLIQLENVTVSVLVERNIEGEKVPEPLGIKEAQLKTFRQINDEIRSVKKSSEDKLGSLSRMAWVRFIPGFLMRTFIRIADRNLKLALKYGKVAVTAVGMFSKDPIWFIPHGSATVLVTVGSISNKVVEIDGKYETREHLCLTVSFDHDIVDGAPAARFMNDFLETVRSGSCLN